MNKGTDRGPSGEAVSRALAAVNVITALGSGGSAVAALVKPELLLPEGYELTPAAGFYAKMYAARSVPLCVMVVILTFLGSTNRLGVFLILADLVQAADALIGAGYRIRGQTILPAAAAAVHLASARLLLRGRP